ncbi:MAG TPA: putative toxin-antitoxin system toxin component, PIN family [Noviherbaspirillum sp.]
MIPKRLVIDTNVCLDLFVFHDPRWITLRQALENGTVQAYTRDDCRTEWLLVLEYPHLPLDVASRAAATACFDRLIVHRTEVATTQAVPPLPQCKDPDDQKFLELARDVSADVLITKDKALLKLARKLARAGMFAIVPPERWQAP